ncbi:DMT family transporter [Cohnella hashimotonis]|uniref:DMT family transporter n=1 Tax=Cohnella hashimotonis TaxID=2826895 RepID=A0ABT6TFA0_9BACL|nr:DMT family transporter [Cohnella hashimotonis]MDI4644965.1 DMT family transporter [Cohnella hashimotonis]
MPQLSRVRTIVYLAILVTLWGVNGPLSKYALEFASPLLFAGLRVLIGGLILLPLALRSYKKLNLKKTRHIYLISTLLNVVLFYGFQTFGLQMMPAGLFTTIVFLQPVLLGIGAWLWLGESMSGSKLSGLLLGFLGVAVVSASGGAGNMSLVGILLGVASAVSWTFGTIYIKKSAAKVEAIWLVTFQMIVGGSVLLGTGAATEGWKAVVWNVPFISALLFIAIFCTALAWLLFSLLVGSGEAGKVNSFNFLVPLLSIVIGVFFLGETITSKLVAGLVLIILGIALVNLKVKALRKGINRHIGTGGVS